MIRDTGSTIEFWINSNNSTTWSDHIPWSGTVNGVGVGGSYYYHPNSGWNRLGVWGVSYNQNVTFALGNTGTGGFGGPSSHTVSINRASIPSAPSPPVISAIGSTQVHAAFTDGSNNGAAIDDRRISWNTDPALVGVNYVSSNNSDITGLTPGTKYYFWAVTHNSQGWGPWSSRVEATTTKVPDAPTAPTVSNITQTSVQLNFAPGGDGGLTINSAKVWWGTDPDTPSSSATTGEGVTQKIVTGLDPATQYYFRVQTHNSVGYGSLSAATPAMTIAGAYVKVDTLWKLAIPYVKVSGVWKLARPWTRVAGEWKETS